MRVALLLLIAACATTEAPKPVVPNAGPNAAPNAEPKLPVVTGTPALAEPMGKLAFMRGIWAGPASGADRSGPYKVTQTERVGPILGGDVMVIEGRGYRDDNTTGFNAFAAISWNPQTQKYEMRSYAQGYAGTFDLKLTADGYIWEVPAGPNAVMRFTATVKTTTWREIGEYVTEGAAPKQTFEMNLKRVGDTDWPVGTPVSPQLGR
jgi:hypothetical protein